MAEKLIIRPERCKGCSLCVVACPKKALSMGGPVNKGGYKTVAVDDAKCIKCGICYTACPDYVFSIEEVAV